MTTGVAALPAGSMLLHIGPQKTGSTATQTALHEARSILAEHGVLYPGTRVRARDASYAVMGLGRGLGLGPAPMSRWQAVIDELNRSPLPSACMSHEVFARADDAAIERILGGLGRYRTHVVFVARRLDKIVPSYWQERVKARLSLSYDDYLRLLLDRPEEWESRTAWEPQDIGLVVDRWARHVGAENLTILVADESDRRLIPSTFEALLGVPDGTLAPPPSRSNRSMDLTEAACMRIVNRIAREDGWTPLQYRKIAQNGVARSLVRRDSAPDAPRITGLPAWAFDRVAAMADQQVEDLLDARARGVRVIGDPSSLSVRDHARPVEVPAEVESVPLDVLADVVHGLVAGAEQLHRREQRAVSAPAEGDPVANLSGRELVKLLWSRTAGRARVSRG